jgi:hypothetical protein
MAKSGLKACLTADASPVTSWPLRLSLRCLFIVFSCVFFACSSGTETGADQDASSSQPRPHAPDVDDGTDADRTGSGDVGASCRTPGDCTIGLTCVQTATQGSLCMLKCSQTTFCDDGSLCLMTSSGTAAVCYIGGHRAIGESCATTLECVNGARCLAHPNAPDEAYCYRACSLEHTACGPEEYCLTAGSRGVCMSRLGKACSSDDDCPFEDFRTCLEDTPLEGEGLDQPSFYPAGYCTRTPCTGNQDCAEGLCRALTPSTPPVCLKGCEVQSDCRYYHGYDCLDSDVCASTVDPAACRTFFGGRRLCLAALPSFDL